MKIYFEVLQEAAGVKLSLFLRRQGVSAALIKSVKYKCDGLTCNQQPVKTNYIVKEKDTIGLQLPMQEEMRLEAEEIPLSIIYETVHTMIIDKPAGLVMHPTSSHSSGTMGNGFAGLMKKRGSEIAFRPIGRLDRNTSGLVLCAMNAYSAPLLAASYQKEYLALVEGGLCKHEGIIDTPIGPCEGSLIQQCVCSSGKQSRTEYTVLSSNGKVSLVRVRPQTGRTHQIRVHFSSIGNPLLGDSLYGGEMSLLNRHALHCAGISFKEPQMEGIVKCSSTIPEDMKKVCISFGLQWDE